MYNHNWHNFSLSDDAAAALLIYIYLHSCKKGDDVLQIINVAVVYVYI